MLISGTELRKACLSLAAESVLVTFVLTKSSRHRTTGCQSSSTFFTGRGGSTLDEQLSQKSVEDRTRIQMLKAMQAVLAPLVTVGCGLLLGYLTVTLMTI